MDLSPARALSPTCHAASLRARWGAYLVLFLAAWAYPGTSVEAQAVPPVETELVREAPVVRKLELSGTVTSPHASQVSTSVEGLVSAVHFDSSARVKQGDLLLELDTELEEAAYAQAEAHTAQAAAEVEDAKRRLRIAESLAKRDYGPKNEVEARQAEVEIDTATHDSFKAEQKRRMALLARHKLPAPYDGVISERMVEVGQWVEPGTAVFELVAMRDFRVDVPVPQDYYARLREGAEVEIEIDSLPGETVPAKIGALIPVSDPDARTFTLRVLPMRDDIPITPGMSARVLVNLDTGKRDDGQPRRADPLSGRADHRVGPQRRRRRDQRHRAPDRDRTRLRRTRSGSLWPEGRRPRRGARQRVPAGGPDGPAGKLMPGLERNVH